MSSADREQHQALAEARAKDGRGSIHANNSSLDIRMISPKIDLLLRPGACSPRGGASIPSDLQQREDSLTDLRWMTDGRWPGSRPGGRRGQDGAWEQDNSAHTAL